MGESVARWERAATLVHRRRHDFRLTAELFQLAFAERWSQSLPLASSFASQRGSSQLQSFAEERRQSLAVSQRITSPRLIYISTYSETEVPDYSPDYNYHKSCPLSFRYAVVFGK